MTLPPCRLLQERLVTCEPVLANARPAQRFVAGGSLAGLSAAIMLSRLGKD
jgi:predicted O-methyltransferase YrrM